MPPEVRVRVDAIRVEGRHRQYLGDVSTLAASIKDIGLINPVTLTADNRLVAGARRLQAVRVLGWEEIPARYVSTLDTAVAALRAERDENTERLAMRTSELVSLGKALEELERPRAADRKRAGQEQGRAVRFGSSSREDEPQTPTPRGSTDAIVASALGMGETTYHRAKTVVAAALDPDATPEDRQVAQGALSNMDDTGNVAGNYDKVRGKIKVGRGKRPSRPDATLDGASQQRHAITAAIAHMEGVAMGLDRIRVIHPSITREEAARLADGLSKPRTSITVLINRLREYSNAKA